MMNLKAFLTELATDGASGDPLNYMKPAQEGLQELATLQAKLQRYSDLIDRLTAPRPGEDINSCGRY